MILLVRPAVSQNGPSDACHLVGECHRYDIRGSSLLDGLLPWTGRLRVTHHRARAEVDRHLKAGYCWVVDADLQSYFDSIPHLPLLAKVAERIADGRVLELIQFFLKQDIMEDMTRWTPTSGSPQGAVVSPLLANLYLHELDVDMRARICSK
jgi:Reverse transcriptase (RNA-dependent DNA polymerase)